MRLLRVPADVPVVERVGVGVKDRLALGLACAAVFMVTLALIREGALQLARLLVKAGLTPMDVLELAVAGAVAGVVVLAALLVGWHLLDAARARRAGRRGGYVDVSRGVVRRSRRSVGR